MGDGLTPFELVGFRVVPNVRGLGFSYLHLTVFLGLSQSKIILVPLQTRTVALVNRISPSTTRVRSNMVVTIATRDR